MLSSDNNSKPKEKVRQRAQRACLSCRALKAKCELEDKSSEKCIRCTREQKDCVFVASRRGGQNSKRRHQRSFVRQQEQQCNAYSTDNLSQTDSIMEPVPNNAESAQQKTTNKSVAPEDELGLGAIRNPSDSLGLLARTAFHADAKQGRYRVHKAHGTTEAPTSVHDKLAKFCLVQKDVLRPVQLKTLVSTFFSRHHQYMPIIPAHRVPLNDGDLCAMAESEPLLVVTFIIIASRFEDMRVHTTSWEYMSQVIQELALGIRRPTLGAIESLLLLSESIPEFPRIDDRDAHDFEERFCWHLVGQAVRMSYYLGLDQVTLLRQDETLDEAAHRMRLIWTYCYFEERQTSIRLGKAFLTRGPTLCFPVPYVNTKSGSESFYNFPTLVPSAYSREDYASYTQALIDITYMMSNIHDLLYPSRDRTISLAHLCDYHKILDELTMGFATFKLTWDKKKWGTLSLNETVWVSFYYAKLYAYGFAFQAHMKRMNDACEQQITPQSIFPKTLSAASDAKFIIEAKDAAVSVLEICIDKLHSYGALAHLPCRYYGYFGYAAVFLVKVVFTAAVHYEEQKEILDLIRRTIVCICDGNKGVDRNHPLMRCAQQLRMLLQTLWSARGVNFGDDCNNRAGDPDHIGEDLQDIPLADDIKDMVDNFSLDQFSPEFMQHSTEAAIQDLTASLSNDLNSEFWLSYFELYGNEVATDGSS